MQLPCAFSVMKHRSLKSFSLFMFLPSIFFPIFYFYHCFQGLIGRVILDPWAKNPFFVCTFFLCICTDFRDWNAALAKKQHLFFWNCSVSFQSRTAFHWHLFTWVQQRKVCFTFSGAPLTTLPRPLTAICCTALLVSHSFFIKASRTA